LHGCNEQNERNVPGAVDGRDGVAIVASVLKEFEEIISSDNSGRNNINKRHDDDDKYTWCGPTVI